MGQKLVRFEQLGAARSRQDEPIERRPKEQGTQDAHKGHLRGCGYSLAWPLKPTPMRRDAAKSPLLGLRLGWAYVAQPGRRAAAQGGAQGGGGGAPQRFLRSCWAGVGLWADQEGQMSRKLVHFGSLKPTRSRHDASREVHEAGRIRPSSGGSAWETSRLLGWADLLVVVQGPRIGRAQRSGACVSVEVGGETPTSVRSL
jgi:hypothetical protein